MVERTVNTISLWRSMFRLQTLGLTVRPGNLQRYRKQSLHANTAISAKDNKFWGRQKVTCFQDSQKKKKNQLRIGFCFSSSNVAGLSQWLWEYLLLGWGWREQPREAWCTKKVGSTRGENGGCWSDLRLPRGASPAAARLLIQSLRMPRWRHGRDWFSTQVLIRGPLLLTGKSRREQRTPDIQSGTYCSGWKRCWDREVFERGAKWRADLRLAWGSWPRSLIWKGWQPSNRV